MLAILNVTIPFFALVLCGYVAARAKKLPEQTVAALNGFVLYFALPAMLFRFASAAPFETIVDPPVFAAYGLAGLAILAMTAFGLRWGNRDNWHETAFGAMAASWANWGYMGFALIPAVLGKEVVATIIAGGIADLVLVVSAALAIASREGRAGEHWSHTIARALGGVARNPLIWAIGAGLVVSALALPLPLALDEFLRLLGTAAGPVALFSIGVSLYRPQRTAIHGDTFIIVLTKLVIHPLLAWTLALHVFGLAPLQAATLMLMAALPAAGSAFLFAERHGASAERAAAIIMVSTALAFASFTGFAALTVHLR